MHSPTDGGFRHLPRQLLATRSKSEHCYSTVLVRHHGVEVSLTTPWLRRRSGSRLAYQFRLLSCSVCLVQAGVQPPASQADANPIGVPDGYEFAQTAGFSERREWRQRGVPIAALLGMSTDKFHPAKRMQVLAKARLTMTPTSTPTLNFEPNINPKATPDFADLERISEWSSCTM